MTAIGRKWVTKKVLHDYSAVIVVSVSLLVILLALILSRYGSLYSIRDIANINPLITTGTSELIAVDVNGVIKIAKDDASKVSESTKKPLDSSKQVDKGSDGNTSGSTQIGTTGSSGGTGAAGGNTGNTGNNGGVANNNNGGGGGVANNNNGTTTDTPPSAKIVSYMRNPLGDRPGTTTGGRCTRDYSFSLTVSSATLSSVGYTMYAGGERTIGTAYPPLPLQNSVRVRAANGTTITDVKVVLDVPGSPTATLEDITHKC